MSIERINIESITIDRDGRVILSDADLSALEEAGFSTAGGSGLPPRGSKSVNTNVCSNVSCPGSNNDRYCLNDSCSGATNRVGC